jgi:integrase
MTIRVLPELMSIDQALNALPVRKSRRWLVSLLHRTPDAEFGTLLRALLYTGLRLGEVLEWHWEDLNLEKAPHGLVGRRAASNPT